MQSLTVARLRKLQENQIKSPSYAPFAENPSVDDLRIAQMQANPKCCVVASERAKTDCATTPESGSQGAAAAAGELGGNLGGASNDVQADPEVCQISWFLNLMSASHSLLTWPGRVKSVGVVCVCA